ncbi:MAG: hypothetical protein ACRC46_05770 [Thermoguttaceae bacterium]
MKANLISMNILVDSSGSMAPIAADMAGSLNQLVKENRELDVLVTYSIFSDNYQPVFADKPIKKVKEFTLTPTSSTALIESACKMIDEVGERLAATPDDKRAEKVMFVIVTDGEENASDPEYTKSLLLNKIKHQTEAYNWLFLYLGANQDAITVAESYGISADRAIDWTPTKDGAARNTERLSRKILMAYCATPEEMQSIGFDAEDREEEPQKSVTKKSAKKTVGKAPVRKK